MAVTLVGLIYYADDPDKKVFRVVTPTESDSELDQPDPVLGAWTEFGLDGRAAVIEKVALGDPRAVSNGWLNNPPTLNGEPV